MSDDPGSTRRRSDGSAALRAQTSGTTVGWAEPGDRPRAPSSIELLLETRRHIDQILAGMPKNLSQARQFVGEELWHDPTKEEFEAVFRIACDRSPDGPRVELTRHALALRYRSEQILDEYWMPAGIDPVRMREVGERVTLLAAAMAQFDRSFKAATEPAGKLAEEDRAFLQQTVPPLHLPRKALGAAATLAPTHVRFAEAVETGTYPRSLGFLSGEDRDLIARLGAGAGGEARPGDRPGLESIVLRWRIIEDLEVWHQLPAGVGSENRGWRAAARNLRKDLGSYRAVSNFIQDMQDDAAAARDTALSEALSVHKRQLLAALQKLAPVVRGIGGLGDAPLPPKEEVAPKKAAPLTPPGALSMDPDLEQAREKAFREAMFGEKTKSEPLVDPQEVAKTREESRTRVRMLLRVLAVLVVVLVAVHVLLPEKPPPRIEVTPEEFAAVLEVSRVEPIGTLLHARVGAEWNGLDERRRKSAVLEMSGHAVRRGFRALHLADESGAAVATWTSETGVALIGSSPAD